MRFGPPLPGELGNNDQAPSGWPRTSIRQPSSSYMRRQLLGQGGALGNPMAKVAVAGIAAMAAKHFLGR